ncbi:MAG: hypothetical protein JW725_00150 [Candidatus Babeliaceae bacterium]|nr:hypothetical protein [Candidatus Babeliaceae bacterium]
MMGQRVILPELQAYLQSRGIVAEKNNSFYAWWASRFLDFNNGHEDLQLEASRAGVNPSFLFLPLSKTGRFGILNNKNRPPSLFSICGVH